MSQAPLVDMAKAIQQLGGNHDLLHRLYQRFVEDYADTSQKTKSLLEQGDWHGAQHMVHAIKGVAGNLGLQRLYQVCVTLDALLKAQDQAALKHLHDFNEILAHTLAALAEQANAPQPQQSVSAIPMARQGLMNALQNREFIPMEKLQGYLAGIDTDAQLKQQLASLVDSLEYDAAIALLSTLKE